MLQWLKSRGISFGDVFTLLTHFLHFDLSSEKNKLILRQARATDKYGYLEDEWELEEEVDSDDMEEEEGKDDEVKEDVWMQWKIEEKRTGSLEGKDRMNLFWVFG